MYGAGRNALSGEELVPTSAGMTKLSPSEPKAERGFATFLQKEFDSCGSLPYTHHTDGVAAEAADTVSGLRDDV
jgi:hypothetical protein